MDEVMQVTGRSPGTVIHKATIPVGGRLQPVACCMGRVWQPHAGSGSPEPGWPVLA